MVRRRAKFGFVSKSVSGVIIQRRGKEKCAHNTKEFNAVPKGGVFCSRRFRERKKPASSSSSRARAHRRSCDEDSSCPLAHARVKSWQRQRTPCSRQLLVANLLQSRVATWRRHLATQFWSGCRSKFLLRRTVPYSQIVFLRGVLL